MKRHYLAILFIPLLCLMLAACGGTSSTTTMAPDASTTPAAKTRTGEQTVKIMIGDFYIHSPVTTFTTGTKYQFVIINLGSHYHNFLIMHPTQSMITVADMNMQALGNVFNIAPGQTKILNFIFDHTAPPGMLDFSCHYGGHYEAGMYQAIVVNAAPGASVSPYPNNGIPLSTYSQADTGPCDPVVTTKIVNGVYTPENLSLKSGDTLTIINTDSQSYTPLHPPGTRLMVGDSNTTYLTFFFAGTFSVSSKEHPDTQATISVSAGYGTTCGMTTPVTTVNFDANYADPKNHYFFTPTQEGIKKGQSIRLSNLVDQNLTFISTPDAGFGNIEINKSSDEDLKFIADGIYTISCVQFPDKKFTVTVQGT